MYTYKRGFTLIELLVVIAIIGILASIVLVSLNSARSKGKDTRVISDVNQARNIIETNVNNVGPYLDLYSSSVNATDVLGTFTTNGPGNASLTALNADANASGGANMTFYINTNSTNGNANVPNAIAYAIYGKTSTGYYCVDYKGNNLTNTTGGTIPAANGAITCH